MNTEKYLNKRTRYFLLSLGAICLVTIISLFIITKKENVNTQNIEMYNNIQVIYENSDKLLKNSSYPLTFQQGNEKSPNNLIKIVNKWGISTRVTITLEQKNASIDTLDLDKIYCSVDNGEPKLLINEENSTIFDEIVEGYSEKDINIKLWASSELVTNEDQGKTYDMGLNVKIKWER